MSNEISYEYYCVLSHHTWSRHKAFKIERQNGSHVYFTYHVINN